MKVLQKGTKKNWGIEIICSGIGNNELDSACGAVLMVEEGDIFSTREFEREGNGDFCYTFECPQCKTWTDISPSRLPSFIKDKAQLNIRYPSDRGKERKGYGD